jgi:phage N-6-adenine-methyltransferase
LKATNRPRFPNGLLVPGGNPEGQCYQTPRYLFDRLYGIFRFTVDACASANTALLTRFWSVEDDALRQDWSKEIVFCNPPFNNIAPFLVKARTARRAVVLAPLNFCTAVGFQARPPDHLIVPDHRIRFVTGKEPVSPVFGTAFLIYGPLTHQEQQALGGVCFSTDPLAPFLGQVYATPTTCCPTCPRASSTPLWSMPCTGPLGTKSNRLSTIMAPTPVAATR